MASCSLKPVSLNGFCRGVLLGGLVGDCYGYVYEDKKTVDFGVPLSLLSDSSTGISSGQLIYTDDTQMGIGTLKSIRLNGGVNLEHLAKQFATDFFDDGAHRYYGGSIATVFGKLRATGYKNPFLPASEQFNGGGSFGNGGAMRIAPAALYGLNMPEESFENYIVDVTRVTHSHPLAVCGALLQAFAVRNLYRIVSTPHIPLDHTRYLNRLLENLRNVRCPFVNFKDSNWKAAFDAYRSKFQSIEDLLANGGNPSVQKIVSTLGNDLKAINSVPTAIYCFLRSLKPIPGIPLDSIVLRCLVFSIGLGGDTDTISCMACALAGGYVGFTEGDESVIPKNILKRCENYQVVSDLASWLS